MGDEDTSNKQKGQSMSIIEEIIAREQPAEDDNIDEENLPSRQECQALTEQFAEITSTDTALAQFFLQDRSWNLQKSLDAFYASKSGSGAAPLEAGGAIRAVADAAPLALGCVLTTTPPDHLTILSWNIDGIEKNSLKRRAKAVIKIIEENAADVVQLQEVVPEVLHYLQEKLPHYMVIAASDTDYFIATLLRRTTVYFDGHTLEDFPDSRMGRNLLSVQAHVGSCRLHLLTSHLESCADSAPERKAQLRTCFSRLTSGEDNAVLAGDLNLRDSEAAEVGLPAGVVDVWEQCGARKEVRYTWDLRRNTNKQMGGKFPPRLRFDRVYLRTAGAGQGPRLRARFFGLVGLERVKGTQWFPSDHWGLLTHYDIVP